MATVTLHGNSFQNSGELPTVGSQAPEFKLVNGDLADKSLADYTGKKVLNIFPSVDTPVCAVSMRVFNEKASSLENTTVLCISADLPFAQKRFCGAENLDKVESLSSFRSSFAKDYGLEILDGPLAGLCSRCVLVLDENNKVVYTELVTEISQEPNYQEALAALQ